VNAPIKFFMRKLHRAVAAIRYSLKRLSSDLQHSAALEQLRTDHPGCTIMSSSIYDSQLGEGVAIHGGVSLDLVRVGNFSYIANNSKLSNVEVGKFCSIGQQVQVGLSRHPSRDFVSSYPAFYSNSNEACTQSFREDTVFDDSILRTRLGNDVWLGSNVIIPGGISIGTGAIVAAGSVVVKDVPPYTVVGGNPSRVIRRRFTDEQIDILLASEWWNWPIDKIRKNIDGFSDIDKFKNISR